MKLSAVYVSPRWCPGRPVVQTLDSAIHRINRYPTDKFWENQLRYPVDRDLDLFGGCVIHLSNNSVMGPDKSLSSG